MIRMPGTSYRGPLPPLTERQRVLEQELRAYVHALAHEIGERNLYRYSELTAAAEFIHATLAGFGYEVQHHRYEVAGRMAENLEVEIRGVQRPDEILLVGGHYDSVQGSPGANDNATGVAAVLALARELAAARPMRTLRFVAFTNEEPPFFQTGYMGSLLYAQRSRQRKEHIVVMLSLETLGYYSDEPRSQTYPFPLGLFYPSTADFIAFVSNTDNGPWDQRLVESFRRRAEFPSEGAALWPAIPGVAWSDHWAFWQQGYPAVMVTDTAPNRYPYYHTPYDSPDKVNFERLARVVSGLEQVVWDTANREDENVRRDGR